MSSTEAVKQPSALPVESKSARKKKVKGDATASASSAKQPGTPQESSAPESHLNGTDASGDSPYIRELQKGIRNVNKKLNAMQKVDSILAENPGKSLDELVATRKINTDQKEQALRKPQLQTQLNQYEEQLAHYKKFDQDYQQRLAAEKERLQGTHKEELDKLRNTAKAEAMAEAQKAWKERLLNFTRFLRAAAAQRQKEGEENTDQAKAFEGALLLVYGGDSVAVATAEKLIDGVEEGVPSTEGTLLGVTYAQIKQVSIDETPFTAEEAWAEGVAQADPTAPDTETSTPATTDPTVANASLTELQTEQLPNGTEELETPSAPPTTSVDDGAANAAAGGQWDAKNTPGEDPLAESFEMVPRNPSEVESPAVAAPTQSTQSWADDTPDVAPPIEPATTPNGNDGFREVVHPHRGSRGRGDFGDRGRGGFRGRGGPRGDSRGRGGFRGERGDGRARGRGGPARGRGRGD